MTICIIEMLILMGDVSVFYSRTGSFGTGWKTRWHRENAHLCSYFLPAFQPWEQVLKGHFVLIPGFKSCLKSWILLEILNHFTEFPFNLTFCTVASQTGSEHSLPWNCVHSSLILVIRSYLFPQIKGCPFVSSSLLPLLGIALWTLKPTMSISHLTIIVLSCWFAGCCSLMFVVIVLTLLLDFKVWVRVGFVFPSLSV